LADDLRIYFLVGVLFFHSGKSKLLDEGDPARRTRPCPAELRVPAVRPDLHGNNQGTASLYTYFGSTAVMILLLLRLPPNRPLSG